MKTDKIDFNKIFVSYIYGYCALPFVAYALFALPIYLGIPLAAMAVVALVVCVRESSLKFDWLAEEGRNTLVLACVDLTAVLWVILASRVWTNAMGGVSYFIPRVVYAVLGLEIVFILLGTKRGVLSLWPCWLLVLFSGLDIVGSGFFREDAMKIFSLDLLEGWTMDVQFWGLTTQLFFGFNQAVFAWIAVMLMLVENNKKLMVFSVACLMMFSTFPILGLLPLVAIVWLKDRNYNLKAWLLLALSLVIMALAVIKRPSPLFMTGIQADSGFASLIVSAPSFGAKFMIWAFVEFLVFVAFVYRYEKHNLLLYVAVAELLVIPIGAYAAHHEYWASAISMPLIFLIYVMVVEAMPKLVKDKRWIILVLLSLTLVLGAVTPAHELAGSLNLF
ncbi:MAG: hypothetical protein HUJ70_07505 [Pseudobutyrivibrio sp.]|nr:hypothetical protein [Pseudobutyrivibrio sp.]